MRAHHPHSGAPHCHVHASHPTAHWSTVPVLGQVAGYRCQGTRVPARHCYRHHPRTGPRAVGQWPPTPSPAPRAAAQTWRWRKRRQRPAQGPPEARGARRPPRHCPPRTEPPACCSPLPRSRPRSRPARRAPGVAVTCGACLGHGVCRDPGASPGDGDGAGWMTPRHPLRPTRTAHCDLLKCTASALGSKVVPAPPCHSPSGCDS